MSSAAVRIGVGTRLVHDGELVEIVEIHAGRTGMDVVLKCTSKQALIRASFNELLTSGATRVIPERDGPSGDDDFEPAGVVLAQLSGDERNEVIDRAAHVREAMSRCRDVTRAKRVSLVLGCARSSVGCSNSRRAVRRDLRRRTIARVLARVRTSTLGGLRRQLR